MKLTNFDGLPKVDSGLRSAGIIIIGKAANRAALLYGDE